MKYSQSKGRISFIILCSIGLLLFSFGGLAHAEEEADGFSLPSDSESSGGDSPPADSPPDDNPPDDANPAESPDPESGGGAAVSSVPEIDPSLPEPEQVEKLAQEHVFKPLNEKKDPFKPLVRKKVVLPPPPPVAPPSGQNTQVQVPVVKPIQMLVSRICGNDNERIAMITFENKFYVVQKEQNVDGKFKVVDILSDKVVVYSNKEQMRRSFSIGGEKK